MHAEPEPVTKQPGHLQSSHNTLWQWQHWYLYWLCQMEKHIQPLCFWTTTGAEWATFNTPTSWPRRNRCILYGSNDLQLAKPSFFPIFLQTLSFILFLIQVCHNTRTQLFSLSCMLILPAVHVGFSVARPAPI